MCYLFQSEYWGVLTMLFVPVGVLGSIECVICTSMSTGEY